MIRFNHNSVLPWTIIHPGHTSRLSDEDFFVYNRDQSHIGFDTENFALLGETLRRLDMISEQNGSFYVNNRSCSSC